MNTYSPDVGWKLRGRDYAAKGREYLGAIGGWMDLTQHDACRIAKHYADAFRYGYAERNRRLTQWEPMTERYQRVFDVFKSELVIHRFFVDAYINLDMLDIRPTDGEVEQGRREDQGGQSNDADVICRLPTITIWLGNSIVWASKLQGKNSNSFLSEGGCTLSVTQQLDGSAVVSILPCRPQIGSRDAEKEVLILGVYRNPSDIDGRKVLRHFEEFLAYAISSSLHGAPTRAMRWTLGLAKGRHWWLTKFQPSMVGQWFSRIFPAVIKVVSAMAKGAPAAVV